MKPLRNLLEKVEPNFREGGKLHKLWPVYDGFATFLFVPGHTTHKGVHIRDGIDLKRTMIMVVLAMIPALLFGIYNVGYQHFQAIGQLASVSTGEIIGYGMLKVLPLVVVSYAVGLGVEFAFCVIKKHQINEGFLVSGMLIPLTCPPDMPLWMVAIATVFAVVIGKEVFGGTGMNVLNVALTARAFLFFAYPAYISGDKVWIAANVTDGTSGATWLARMAEKGLDAVTVNGQCNTGLWLDSFFGFIPGSMGETSAFAALIGAIVLIVTQIGSWRTMAGVLFGTIFTTVVLNLVGSDTNPMFAVPFYWHIVVGGWAFGTVFMATDPVTSAFTEAGKWFYGFGIGVMVILIRVVNPAYPEGMMLAILFMNMFAPFIDYFFVQANIKRRLSGYGRVPAQAKK